MSRLRPQLQRLYGVAQSAAEPQALELVGAAGQVRAMVLELAAPAASKDISTVWQRVQADLDLPAPAIAIDGVDGLQLWFSVQEAVPWTQAAAFLDGLRLRYLAELAPQRVRMFPSGEGAVPGPAHVATVPPAEAGAGRWAAFLAPDLAALFADEPWLDVQPGSDAQAELLSTLRTISADELRRALEQLYQPFPTADEPAAAQSVPTAAAPSVVAYGGLDPKAFLLRVMNDPAVPLALRIEAAKALLASATERGSS